MVVLSHQMAYESSKVRGDMVEVSEFPHLGQKYRVMGVPRTVINESEHIEGQVPEKMLVDKMRGVL